MRIASTETEITTARLRSLPHRYKHFRQSIWQNYTEIGTRALTCGETPLAHRMFTAALLEARQEENIDYRLAVSFAHVGHCLLAEGNLSAAANTYLRALSIARNVNDTPKVFHIMLLETLADIRLNQGHFRLAKRHLTRAIELREEFLPSDKQTLAKALIKLAHIFSELGDADHAVTLYARSKSLR